MGQEGWSWTEAEPAGSAGKAVAGLVAFGRRMLDRGWRRCGISRGLDQVAVGANRKFWVDGLEEEGTKGA